MLCTPSGRHHLVRRRYECIPRLRSMSSARGSLNPNVTDSEGTDEPEREDHGHGSAQELQGAGDLNSSLTSLTHPPAHQSPSSNTYRAVVGSAVGGSGNHTVIVNVTPPAPLPSGDPPSQSRRGLLTVAGPVNRCPDSLNYRLMASNTRSHITEHNYEHNNRGSS